MAKNIYLKTFAQLVYHVRYKSNFLLRKRDSKKPFEYTLITLDSTVKELDKLFIDNDVMVEL